MPNITDENLLEENHWDKVSERGGTNLRPNQFVNRKLIQENQKVYRKIITSIWPNHTISDMTIGEIGCGQGSAITYLGGVKGYN
jgi:hypothetical protein